MKDRVKMFLDKYHEQNLDRLPDGLEDLDQEMAMKFYENKSKKKVNPLYKSGYLLSTLLSNKNSEELLLEYAEREDAIGDIIIYIADYCGRNGINLQGIVEKTWDQVSNRDWARNPEDGK